MSDEDKEPLKSRKIFPLKEREDLFHFKRGTFKLYKENSSDVADEFTFISVKDYFKVLDALNAAEEQIIKLTA